MKASHFSPDIQEFLFLLSIHKVKYVIVGGEAVIYYGFARLTGDIDFFYEPTANNVQLLYRSLDEFWQGSIPGIQSPSELASKGLEIPKSGGQKEVILGSNLLVTHNSLGDRA